MLFVYRLFVVGLLSVGIAAATTAQAGLQLFEASWTIKAFGNELTGGSAPSDFYSAWGIPQGVQCNPYAPRCSSDLTPTTGMGKFNPVGGTVGGMTPYCAPWSNWRGLGTTARPAKGGTVTSMGGKPVPPLYRNPQFFTSGGQPNSTICDGLSTVSGGPGVVQVGVPVTGTWTATTTGTQLGGFNFGAAPASGSAGVRVTGQVGVFNASYPYVYSYTYATLRNDLGIFGPGYGPGSFTIDEGNPPLNSIKVTQGAAKFGGTMQMLGALTAKACYYWNQGCSLGQGVDWLYDAIGASGVGTNGGVVTAGYKASTQVFYYHTALGVTSTVDIIGSRFPWTTGSVTVTAIGRGPHKTIHYAHGYDNRNTTTPNGMGTIQLVSPLLTRWRQPGLSIDTGGIGIFRIKFLPEPQAWAMLVAGASLLAVGTRMRRR